ncbi:acetate kinase [Aquiluna sp.]|nr:acetate kinase [Aquiluna sp.]
MKPILVINSGSSSLKYQVIDVANGNSLLSGTIERLEDHSEAFQQALDALSASSITPLAVGHRVVHGGERFSEPVLIDDEVEDEIEKLIPLAPLHNPGNLSGIRAARRAFPELKQVAVFDTAFHQSMPESSYSYAIDTQLAREHGIRKYGFHGTSHSYVTKQAAKFLKVPLARFNGVVLHLGNGASACAIEGGRSLDTSMGMTPLAGLVMGTRSGDIDPGVIFYLSREVGLSLSEIDELLNKESGLRGIAGVSDFRDLSAAADSGEPEARLAIEVFVERARQYLGGYLARLGRVDAVIFTAGVGENSPAIRAAICADLASFGIAIDKDLNTASSSQTRVISNSEVKVLVVPTNEELEIASLTAALI